MLANNCYGFYMTERLKCFNRVLRKIVVPSLNQKGFAFMVVVYLENYREMGRLSK
jgi:hypothetical protein